MQTSRREGPAGMVTAPQSPGGNGQMSSVHGAGVWPPIWGHQRSQLQRRNKKEGPDVFGVWTLASL